MQLIANISVPSRQLGPSGTFIESQANDRTVSPVHDGATRLSIQRDQNNNTNHASQYPRAGGGGLVTAPVAMEWAGCDPFLLIQDRKWNIRAKILMQRKNRSTAQLSSLRPMLNARKVQLLLWTLRSSAIFHYSFRLLPKRLACYAHFSLKRLTPYSATKFERSYAR